MKASFLHRDFIASSLIMIVGSNIYNVGQFIFHLLLARFLGKVGYGDLAVVISILGIIAILQQGFAVSIVKHITAGKDDFEVKGFIKWIISNTLLSCLVILLVFGVLGYPLQFYLKFSNPSLVFWIGPIAALLIFATTTRAILQGLLKFGQFSISLTVEIISRIAVLLGLAVFDFKIFAASASILLSYSISSLLNYLLLKKDLRGVAAKRMPGFFSYSFSAFISGLSLTSLYSMDLILVKAFFSGEEAGLYAAISVLGRIIFFGITPFTQTMFPLVSKRSEQKLDYLSLFFATCLIIIFIALFCEMVFYFIPNFLVNILYGSQYTDISSYLWKYGIFTGLLGISYHIVQFYLALGKKEAVWIMVASAIIQIALILVYHSSLGMVINNSIVAGVIMLLMLSVYSFWRGHLLKFKL